MGGDLLPLLWAKLSYISRRLLADAIITVGTMSLATKVKAVILVLNSIATIFVGLRTVSRFVILRKSYVDDYLIVAAVTISWILTSLAIARKLDV
jgi:cellulose synthase/poly-beta-1,6-N-acetylglucosamine synthase-like glycosyltransferase